MVNIGNGQKVRLMDFIEAIEAATGRTAIRNFLPMQQGDVPATWADRLTHMQAAAITGGHFFPDTAPQETLRALHPFLKAH